MQCLSKSNECHLELLPAQRWLPLKRMRLLCGIVILLPDLYRLVRATNNQSQTCPVVRRAHDASLRVQGPWLGNLLGVLESVTCLPVPERHGAVVAAGEHDVVFVDSECVDNAVGGLEVEHEVTSWAHPLLDRLRGTRCERKLLGMECQCPNRLLVVC